VSRRQTRKRTSSDTPRVPMSRSTPGCRKASVLGPQAAHACWMWFTVSCTSRSSACEGGTAASETTG